MKEDSGIPENNMKKIFLTFILSTIICVCYGFDVDYDSIMKAYCAKNAIVDTSEYVKVNDAFNEMIKDFILKRETTKNTYDIIEKHFDLLSDKDKAFCFYLLYNEVSNLKQYENSTIPYKMISNAVKYDPNNLTYLRIKAALCMISKSYKCSKECYTKIIQLDKYDSDAYNKLYINALFHKKFNEAKKYATLKFNINQDAKSYLNMMSYALFIEDKKAYSKSIKFINNFIKQNPEYKQDAILQLSENHSTFNHYDLAIETINNNAELFDSTFRYYYLSNIYQKIDEDSLFAYYTTKTLEGNIIEFNDLKDNIRSSLYYYNETNQQIEYILDLLSNNYAENSMMYNLKLDVYKMLKDSVNIYNTMEYITDNYLDQKCAIDFYNLKVNNNENSKQLSDYCYKNYFKYDNSIWLSQYLVLTLNDSTLSISSITDSINKYINTINETSPKAEIYSIYSSFLMTKHADYDLIIESLDSCLKYDSENYNALNNKAYYLAKDSTKLNEAEKLAQKAIKVQPNKSYILDTYAWILYLQKNYFLANIYIDKSIRIMEEEENRVDMDKIVQLYHKGKIQEALNKQYEADLIWTNILNIYDSLNDEQKQSLDKETKAIILEIQQNFNAHNEEQ